MKTKTQGSTSRTIITAIGLFICSAMSAQTAAPKLSAAKPLRAAPTERLPEAPGLYLIEFQKLITEPKEGGHRLIEGDTVSFASYIEFEGQLYQIAQPMRSAAADIQPFWLPWKTTHFFEISNGQCTLVVKVNFQPNEFIEYRTHWLDCAN